MKIKLLYTCNVSAMDNLVMTVNRSIVEANNKIKESNCSITSVNCDGSIFPSSALFKETVELKIASQDESATSADLNQALTDVMRTINDNVRKTAGI